MEAGEEDEGEQLHLHLPPSSEVAAHKRQSHPSLVASIPLKVRAWYAAARTTVAR